MPGYARQSRCGVAAFVARSRANPTPSSPGTHVAYEADRATTVVCMPGTDLRQTVDAVWRMEAAKIVATLTRVVGDVGLAEDLAQEALVDALTQWPAHRCAAQRRRLVDDGRQAQGHRPLAPPGPPRHPLRGAGPRAGNPDRRAAMGSRPHRRRRAAADLHLRAPGAVPRGADRADAAGGRRPDHRGDRARLPVVEGDDRGSASRGPRRRSAMPMCRSRCPTARSTRSGSRRC